MRRQLLTYISLILSVLVTNSVMAKSPQVAPSTAWELIPPLGLQQKSTIDTTLYNYYLQAVPTDISLAYATTGNLGAQGRNMVYMERPVTSDFFFRDALLPWLPKQNNHKFYNTRIPMTLLSYNMGGGKEASQDRLKGDFSGNVNKRLQVGAMVDYIYSKGSYENQAVKNLIYGVSGSYIGDRFEVQTYYNHFNSLNKENGGITDDLYITDPAALQGGQSKISPKAIPTNLTNAHTRITGGEFYLNGKYKLGFWQEDTVQREPNDTLDYRTFVPVTSFVWTLNYNRGKHKFLNTSAEEASKFWDNNYLVSGGNTNDLTSYWSLRNTFGVALLEGFNKYAKAGLSAFLTHEIRRYNQTADTLGQPGQRPEYLSPYPYNTLVEPNATENLLWVGAQLTKMQGKIFQFEATGKIGLIGPAAGEVNVNGKIQSRFKLFGDTASVSAYGLFANEAAPYLMNNYVSNHFIWKNDFGKTRRLRFGGIIDLPFTGTRANVGVENVQNQIYFNEASLPVQHGGSVQVFSAQLEQNFKFGIFNWRNKLVYQTSSDETVLPMPNFAVYSNLFLLFKVAKVLDVQFGVDCNYYTKYYAPSYQPATGAFYNQREMEVGNYPFMNAYVNMKLKKARFYVLLSHFNQGLTGTNYFSMPHYPMNPRKFLLGVSIDFAN